MATIAELLMEKGRRLGQARRESGNISANMWQGVGNAVAGGFERYQQEKAQEPVRRAQALQLEGLEAEAADRATARQTEAQRAQAFTAGTEYLASGKRDVNELVQITGDPALAKGLYEATVGMERLGIGQKIADLYQQHGENLTEAHIKALGPEAWSYVKAFQDMAPKPAGTREIKVVDPDGTERTLIVEDKPGQEFTSTPPPKPETRSLQVQAADALKRGDKAEYNRLRQVIRETSESGRAPSITVNTGEAQAVAPPLDPDSQDIMSQAGLSYNGFLAATGRMSQLPRDQATRNRASAEVAAWARDRGIDVSTLAAQYNAYNEALENNIQRYNRTLLAEGEIASSVANLAQAAKDSGFNDARALNAARQWIRGELNDPKASEYAFFLNQLVNDIALYNAASQGRAALQADLEDAKSVVQRGISAGSLAGMQKAIEASVKKMGTVLEGAVNRSRKNVWDLFGVGDKYKPKGSGGGTQNPNPDVERKTDELLKKYGGG